MGQQQQQQQQRQWQPQISSNPAAGVQAAGGGVP
jgi:hypothetical protein